MKTKFTKETHNEGTKLEVIEVTAVMEFSQGDLVELRSGLEDAKTPWSELLLAEIDDALKE